MAEFVFRLPDLAEGLEDAEVVEWRVAEGDGVQLNQLIGELQTAKATVEIPSPRAGRVLRLHASPGDLVRVGEPLVTLEVDPSEVPGVVGRVPLPRVSGRRVRLRPPGVGRDLGTRALRSPHSEECGVQRRREARIRHTWAQAKPLGPRHPSPGVPRGAPGEGARRLTQSWDVRGRLPQCRNYAFL